MSSTLRNGVAGSRPERLVIGLIATLAVTLMLQASGCPRNNVQVRVEFNLTAMGEMRKGGTNCTLSITAMQAQSGASLNFNGQAPPVSLGNDQFATATLNLDQFKERGFDRDKGNVTLQATLTCNGTALTSAATTVDPKNIPARIELNKIGGIFDPPPAPGTVIGGLYDAETDTPIPNGVVTLLPIGSVKTLSDASGLFALTGLPISSQQLLSAKAPGFLTTLRPVSTCSEGNTAMINLVSLPERDAALSSLSALGITVNPMLGVIVGTVQNRASAGIPNAMVQLIPSGGSETVLYFNPNPANPGLASSTTVGGFINDATFLIININPALGPFTVRAATAAGVVGTVSQVSVKPSNILSGDGIVTQVAVMPGPCFE